MALQRERAVIADGDPLVGFESDDFLTLRLSRFF